MIKILFHVSLFWWMQLYTHLCTYSYSYTIVTNVRGQYSSIVFFYNYGSTAVQWMICSLIYSCIKSEFWLVEWDEKNQECFTHTAGVWVWVMWPVWQAVDSAVSTIADSATRQKIKVGTVSSPWPPVVCEKHCLIGHSQGAWIIKESYKITNNSKVM